MNSLKDKTIALDARAALEESASRKREPEAAKADNGDRRRRSVVWRRRFLIDVPFQMRR